MENKCFTFGKCIFLIQWVDGEERERRERERERERERVVAQYLLFFQKNPSFYSHSKDY